MRTTRHACCCYGNTGATRPHQARVPPSPATPYGPGALTISSKMSWCSTPWAVSRSQCCCKSCCSAACGCGGHARQKEAYMPTTTWPELTPAQSVPTQLLRSHQSELLGALAGRVPSTTTASGKQPYYEWLVYAYSFARRLEQMTLRFAKSTHGILMN
jgi:hypothetical protein